MHRHLAAGALLVAPLAALAASALLPPQGSIRIPGGQHGIGLDDIGYAAALGRVTIPAGATGNLVLLDPASDALSVIPGVADVPAHCTARRRGTSSATFADGHLFANSHCPEQIVTIDPRTLAIVARTPLAGDSDYVRYVARTREIWVTEPDRQQIEVFKLAAGPVPALTAATVIPVSGGPESLAIDNQRDSAYANLWNGKTVQIALDTHKRIAQWPNTCHGSRGLALDAARDRLFVACGEGKVVTLAPAQHGKLLASATAGAGIDIISYSPRLRHLYVPAARAATLTVFDAAPSGALRALAVYKTVPRAHCVANDDAGHVFVCDPRAGAILEINDR